MNGEKSHTSTTEMSEEKIEGQTSQEDKMIREKTEGQAHEHDRDDLREDRRADAPMGQRLLERRKKDRHANRKEVSREKIEGQTGEQDRDD
jgi:hypothetical protein